MGLVRLAAANAALAAFFTGSVARASETESAVGYYSETQLNALVGSLSTRADSQLWKGEGRKTSVSLGYTGKRITFKNPPDLLERQLTGKNTVSEHSLSASVDQGLAVGSTVGLSAGGTKSRLSDARYYGLKIGQWFRSETLQTVLTVRRTDVKSQPIEFTDTDGKRINTPADLHGMNVGLSLTHFTTPTTILRGSASATTRSDRPPAASESFEIRQFVTPADGAVHFAVTHYENVGQIDDTQTFGSIVANNARLEWNQRLFARGILMGGYRYYLESEKPRAADADRKALGTDAIYGSFRWRFGSDLWTGDAPEAYVFTSRYTTNLPTKGYVFGLGGRLSW